MGWVVAGAAVACFAFALVSMVRAGMPAFEPRVPRDIALGPAGCEELVDCSDTPFAIAGGDFDGDGDADVATANQFSADVSVLLGDGTGTLEASTPLSVGDPPVEIAAAKLDDDEDLDLVIAIESAEALAIALGNGDGSFVVAESIDLRGTPAGGANPPSDVAIADMNGDGDLDLVVTSLLANKVTVLLGDGEGSFGAPRVHEVAGGPMRLALGFVDGDAHRDVVVSVESAAAVRVLRGDGAGNLALGESAEVGEGPGAVVIADFDRDGDQDVAVATEDRVDSVFVVLGRGDGTFQPATEFEVGAAPTSLIAADFDGDGILDLMTTDNFGSFGIEPGNTVSVLAGRGDGSFEPRRAFEVNQAPVEALAIDVNGDHKPDIVTANTEGNNVSVLLNIADGPEFDCAGDCDGDDQVSVADLVHAVDLSMRGAASESCVKADVNDDGLVGVDELIRAVRRALIGCPG